MSTNDVPGAAAANADVLRAGCWAEHADGSLIYVKGTEHGQVVYEIYDMAQDPPVSYTDALREADFKRQFSHPPTGTSRERWTWHDKTPFDWSRVMRAYDRPRPAYASAEGQLSAAARVAQSLRLRGRKMSKEQVQHMTEETARRGLAVWERIDRAVRSLFE